MADGLTHTQCLLRNGTIKYNTWLPTKYAKVGKVLSMKMDNGQWMSGWIVQETWTTKPTSEVMEAERHWKSHRDGTDARREKGQDNKPGTWKTPNSRKPPKRKK